MTPDIVYLFSVYHGELTTPNLGNYQAGMTISPSALNESKLLKYFQKIIFNNYIMSSRFLCGDS